ncbi:hypothetical protein Acr_17g0005150 [Actinidia rufa]|uniref:MULE transposase domain-containing protein n=1 Tax=Actinidia rufa TaxID=165716 RepID=A0A7J0G2E3_9ERIC|nr:hypothetical protein Acr_17g0005150 [Actinidia rufa]
MKSGFLNGCRPFIEVDGTHLKGPYGGVLLTAIVLDGINGLFLVVVECECKDRWSFFIYHMHALHKNAMGTRPWSIMSDQLKGLDKVISELFPEATHRLCCSHLLNNFKARLPGLLLRKKFWEAARAFTFLEFNKAVAEMKALSNDAHEWAMKIPLSQWSKHAFEPRIRSGHITNNLAESFNNCLGNLREKPILTMLEGTRTKLMTRFQQRGEEFEVMDSGMEIHYYHPLRKLPGRPRKNRRRKADEGQPGTSQTKWSQTLNCKWCKEFEHNRWTCQRGPVKGNGSSSSMGRGRGRGTTSDQGTGTPSDTPVLASIRTVRGGARGRSASIEGPQLTSYRGGGLEADRC